MTDDYRMRVELANMKRRNQCSAGTTNTSHAGARTRSSKNADPRESFGTQIRVTLEAASKRSRESIESTNMSDARLRFGIFTAEAI